MTKETKSAENPTSEEQDQNHPSKKASIIETSTMIYGVMAAIGAAICIWSHENFWGLISFPAEKSVQIEFLSIIGLALGVLLIGGYFFEYWFNSYREIKKSMMTFLGELTWPQGIYLALISSIGEEILFRGAILPAAGIYITSILFGLLHIGPKGGLSAWSLWAVISSLLLSLIVQSTGSLIPAIIIHFSLNVISIFAIRKDWLKLTAQEQEVLKKHLTDLETQEL